MKRDGFLKIFDRNIAKMKAMTPLFAFDPDMPIEEQRARAKKKLAELISLPEKQTEPKPIIEYTDNTCEDYDEIRFSFESEPGIFIPAHMLVPKRVSGKLPTVICLQGHSTGMHVSLAREPYPSKKPIEVAGDRDFCIQAVKRGYVAIACEQRGFGELNLEENEISCHELYFQAALMGNSLIGERVRDVMALIDAVCFGFDPVDADRIGIMGNSGGGTSSYFAACIDDRIKVCMPSSSFCTFTAAWGAIRHCCCAYVPGILKYMEMPDMAMMIAPRHLIAVNGVSDHLQPFGAAECAFEKVKAIYEAAGAPDNCELVVGGEGHRFYAKEAWPIFDRHI